MINRIISRTKYRLSKHMTFCVQGNRSGVLFKKHLAAWLPDGVFPGFNPEHLPHNPAFCPAIDFVESRGDLRRIRSWTRKGVFVDEILASRTEPEDFILDKEVWEVVASWANVVRADSVMVRDDGWNIVKVIWEKDGDAVLVGVCCKMKPMVGKDLFASVDWPKFSE